MENAAGRQVRKNNTGFFSLTLSIRGNQELINPKYTR
jgi:hypothetical protein